MVLCFLVEFIMKYELSDYLMVIIKDRASMRALSNYLYHCGCDVMWCGTVCFVARKYVKSDLDYGEYIYKRLTRLMDI